MLRAHAEMTVPTAQDSVRASAIRDALQRTNGLDRPVRVEIDAAAVELPPLVSRLLMDILGETAGGRAVILAAAGPEITTHEAADLLDVSRSFLAAKVDSGELPSRVAGGQHRLALADVLAYKADIRAKRREVLREMVRLDQEMGLI